MADRFDQPKKWMEGAQTLMANNPMMSGAAPQMRRFWAAQGEILNDIEDLSEAWFRRRHEASRKGLEAANSLGANGKTDIAEAMEVMNDWVSQSMARLAEDAKDNYEFYIHCTNHLTAGAMDAARESANATKQSVDEAAKTAKPESDEDKGASRNQGAK